MRPQAGAQDGSACTRCVRLGSILARTQGCRPRADDDPIPRWEKMSTPHLLDLRSIARALGGEISGRQILAAGPGHSRSDRSLSVRIEPEAPDGFLVHSFAGDDP